MFSCGGFLVRDVSAEHACLATGGKGGGRPDSAMGGVGDTFKVDEALAMLDDLVKGMTDQ